MFFREPLARTGLHETAKTALIASIFAVTSTLTPLAAESAETVPTKPNILIIVADDLGYGDLGVHGGKEIPTPHLDSLAAGGVRLTNGYVSCPVCSPTRAGLATGRYQQRFGHEFNPGKATNESGQPIGLPLSETTLAFALHDVGYHTAIIGKWHLGAADGYRPLQRGFDEFYGFLGGAHPYIPGGKSAVPADRAQRRAARRGQQANADTATDANAGGAGQSIYRGDQPVDAPPHLTKAFGDEAAAFIKREKGKPFLLYLTFNAVHNPLQPAAEHEARFASVTDPKRRAYAGLLSGLDEAVGTVLEALRTSGHDEDTLVFFISDNGGPQKGNGSNNAPLSGDKGTVHEGGIRVPYFVRWKGKLPAGATYDDPAISLDIPATAAAVAGAKLGGKDREVDGVNLLPHLLGEVKTPPHEALYWRFGPQHAVRRGNYKLAQIGDEAPRLFDLANDVGEKKDLASSNPQIVEELDKLYAAWDGELAEPLWKKNQAAGRRNAIRRANRRAAQAVEPANVADK